ncbi:hypothetical protein PUNSTDRAFT_43189 [Punctularia strigosozonata HHB-11173 SS5]|uniref:uncharacterized protein n=1 Tax=Punctularia strigosozonata (strain HHB-11173) TaxID=741275 RepID=UPI000441629A|nr:uncharacterized protein PUNSTDRAFT_43189 [Punctularia strigosozonata HHB-11173 SS5]EIN10197.1 hypothetical protein PUNSTDRAFT_43189 [Punctularia strigosozonata HHB-11173 SS5]
MADTDTLMNFDDDTINEFLNSPTANNLTAVLSGAPYDGPAVNSGAASTGIDTGSPANAFHGPGAPNIDQPAPELPTPVAATTVFPVPTDHPSIATSDASSVAIINEDPSTLDPSFTPVDDFLALGYFIFMKKSARQFILRSPDGNGGFVLEVIAHSTLNRFLSFDEKIRSHAVPASAELPDGYYDFVTKFNNLVPKRKACFSTYIPGDVNGTRYYIHGPSPRAIFFSPEIRAVFGQQRRNQQRSNRANSHPHPRSGTSGPGNHPIRKNRPARGNYMGADRRDRNAPAMSDAQLRERILLEAVRETMNAQSGSRF